MTVTICKTERKISGEVKLDPGCVALELILDLLEYLKSARNKIKLRDLCFDRKLLLPLKYTLIKLR